MVHKLGVLLWPSKSWTYTSKKPFGFSIFSEKYPQVTRYKKISVLHQPY
jgi:hypothetical protein